MIDRTIKPLPSGKISFQLPKINSFQLDNSLKVYHVKKTTLPIIQLNLIIPAGNKYCPSSKEGLSTLTAMLIDEGAGGLSSLEISDKIEVLGSILNINSNKEFVTISLLTLKENLAKSLEIFALIVKSPDFTQNDFAREHRRLETQILQLNDDPSYLASKEFNRLVYKGTHYQFPSNGSLESIKNLSKNDVISFYNNEFTPNNSSLVIVGNIEKNEIVELLRYSFDDWKNKSRIDIPQQSIKQQDKSILLVNKKDAEQTEVRVGHFAEGRNSSDFYSRTVLNSILGGQFSSRINLNLREDKGYTYGAHSNYAYNQIGSLFSVATSVKSENTTDALREILFELGNIKTTITKEELEFSKSYLVRRYPSLFETYSQVATNVSLLPIYDLEDNYFDNYINKISEVNIESATKAACNNILLDKMVIVIVGNKESLNNKLNDFSKNHGYNYEIID